MFPIPRNRRAKRALCRLACCPLLSTTAQAQTAWPAKPVTLVVPFAAGWIYQGQQAQGAGVASKGRVPAMPEVPTLEEAGVSGAESGSWIGLLAPAGTPRDIVDRISQGIDDQLTID